MGIVGLRRIVADLLFDRGAVLDKQQSRDGRPVRVGERPDGQGFRLKLHEKNPDAPLSPFYINLRTPDNPKPGPLVRDDVLLIGQVMRQIAFDLDLSYDFVAGIPYAGDPIAKEFARSAQTVEHRMVPVLQLVKEESGIGRRVACLRAGIAPAPGSRAIVVDDLCTRADTKLEAINVLVSAGLIVKDVVVLVDREQGGGRELLQLGYQLHSVYRIRELFGYYARRGVISPPVHGEIVAYLATNG